MVCLSACERAGDAHGAKEAPATSSPLALDVLEAGSDPLLGPILGRVDAANDEGWDSERLGTSTQGALDALLALVREPKAKVPDGVRIQPLRPAILVESYSDKQSRVWRWEGAAEVSPVSLPEAIASLRVPYRADSEVHTKLKTVRVLLPEAGGANYSTEVIFLASGAGGEGVVQQNARWRCVWEGDQAPVLKGVEVLHYEEIIPRG
ncbi:MAG TPA: hypothetical protein VIY86_03585, partial [Pirellulaceae bacterium]